MLLPHRAVVIYGGPEASEGFSVEPESETGAPEAVGTADAQDLAVALTDGDTAGVEQALLLLVEEGEEDAHFQVDGEVVAEELLDLQTKLEGEDGLFDVVAFRRTACSKRR